MTQDKALAQKLAALTATEVFEGRALRLGVAGQTDAISHILQAIDNTMLLRDAVFSVGKSHVTLRVSGKRLQTVEDASDDLQAPEALIGKVLAMDTPDALAQTATLLERLVTQTGTLTLYRREAAAGSENKGAGIGIQALAPAWDAPPSVAIDDPIEVFLAGWLALAFAYIEIEGDIVVEADGDDATIDELIKVDVSTWAAFKRSHSMICDEPSTPRLYLLEGLTGFDGILIAAEFANRRYLALSPQGAIAQVAAAFAATMK